MPKGRGASGTTVVGGGLKKERPRLIRRLDRATASSQLVLRQLELCEWLETVEDRLGAIRQETEAIGAMAREHDKAHAELLQEETASPGMAATAKAVFAVLHFSDRQSPLLEELDEATRRRDDARRGGAQ